MMERRQWSSLRHDTDLQLDALHASFTTYAFARHWHDYYVIGLVEDGAQSFWCRRATYTTPRGGLIVLNPGESHTGQAADERGFGYRALYPTSAHMAQVMAEFGRSEQLPQFPAVRIDAADLASSVRAFHAILDSAAPTIERQTHWLTLLTTLVLRYAADPLRLPVARSEPRAVAQIRAFLEAHYAERITLPTLAAEAGLSPFHLVRVFRRATGVPPHAYLESVRIKQAQQLLMQGLAPAQVAYDAGFSSQSHFTSRFQRIIGITPGRYRKARS
ncbi:MAG TPA: AraC family transcriptional regulator [Roseiflexaceae bacterium]|nr:AraC family transcriptional regulator [Roseiflexaceae bacterium]